MANGPSASYKKEMLAEVLHNKNYERTAEEFKLALGKEGYQPNLISPKKIKKLIKHIDLTEENQIEDLIGYQELQAGLLWMFGILIMVHQFLKQTKQSNSILKNLRKPISSQSHTDT